MNDPQDLTPPGEGKRDPRDGRTPEEIRNGWSFEDWLAYHQERTAAAAERIDLHHPSRRTRPGRANGHRWAFPARRSWRVRPSWQR